MSIQRQIARRLRVSGISRTGSVIAVCGVALAVMIMEMSLAICVGFKNEIRDKLLDFFPPISVDGEISDEGMSGSVVSAIRTPAVLKTDSDYIAVQCVSAVSDQPNVGVDKGSRIPALFGRTDRASDSIVISESMSSRLNVAKGGKVWLYFFVDNSVKVRRFFVADLYRSDFGEFDDIVVYAPFDKVASVWQQSQPPIRTEVYNMPFDSIIPQAQRLQQGLINAKYKGETDQIYIVSTIYDQAPVFFSWLDLLDTNVVVIFILMLAVAALTLISSLFVIILDRVATIGVLRSIGASGSLIRSVFVNIALRLVGIGMLIGNVLAVGLLVVQHYTHFIPLNPQMYYLAAVPVAINWWHILLVNVGFVAFAWLILVLPARIASRIEPAKTMRYE